MYSLDFRLAIKEAEKLSFAELSKRFKVGIASLVRWSKKIEPTLKRKKPATKIDMEALKRDVEEYPERNQYERAERLSVSQKGIFVALKRLGITYKKSLNHPKADPEKRATFCKKIEKHRKEGRPIIFIDESGFAHSMLRTHGYTSKGQRCFGIHDWGAKGRTNVIRALLSGALLTISLFESAINTTVFNAWVAQDSSQNFPKRALW